MKWKSILRPEFVVFVMVAVFYLPVCDLIFSCGCTHLWAGADSHCNIHNPAPPNCPFCALPFHCAGCDRFTFVFQMLPFLLTVASSGITIYLMRRKFGRHYFREIAAGTLAAVLTMLAVAWIYTR